MLNADLPAAGEQPVRELGKQLYYALFGDEIRVLLMAAQRSVPEGDALRLVLRVDPPGTDRAAVGVPVRPGKG